MYAASMIGIGAMLFHWLEGWSWIDSVCFVVITLTTIGYGGFTPTKPVTKIITIFYG
jgi:voltage-gated potassium channel